MGNTTEPGQFPVVPALQLRGGRGGEREGAGGKWGQGEKQLKLSADEAPCCPALAQFPISWKLHLQGAEDWEKWHQPRHSSHLSSSSVGAGKPCPTALDAPPKPLDWPMPHWGRVIPTPGLYRFPAPEASHLVTSYTLVACSVEWDFVQGIPMPKSHAGHNQVNAHRDCLMHTDSAGNSHCHTKI